MDCIRVKAKINYGQLRVEVVYSESSILVTTLLSTACLVCHSNCTSARSQSTVTSVVAASAIN